MDPVASLAAFFLAAGLLTVTPGVDTALVLRTAAVEGPRRAMAAGGGVILGLLVWGAMTAVGLSALLAVSKTAYLVLQVAGAGYLVFLGGRMLWAACRGDGASQDTAPASGAGSVAGWFLRGLLTNLLNPKVGVFYVSFLPQFIPAGADPLAWSLLLAGVHGLQGAAWFLALIAVTRPLGRSLREPAVVRWLDGVTGSVLVVFGISLALQKRAL